MVRGRRIAPVWRNSETPRICVDQAGSPSFVLNELREKLIPACVD